MPDGRGGFTYRSGIGLHDGDVRVADFNADSRDDVFVYDTSTGRWTLMLSGAEGPTFEGGNWGAGWDVTVAHLNDDRQADLFLWHGASGVWSGCHPRQRGLVRVFLRHVACRRTRSTARSRW